MVEAFQTFQSSQSPQLARGSCGGGVVMGKGSYGAGGLGEKMEYWKERGHESWGAVCSWIGVTVRGGGKRCWCRGQEGSRG